MDPVAFENEMYNVEPVMCHSESELASDVITPHPLRFFVLTRGHLWGALGSVANYLIYADVFANSILMTSSHSKVHAEQRRL